MHSTSGGLSGTCTKSTLDRVTWGQTLNVIKFYKTIKEIEKAADIDIRRGKKEYPC